MLVLTRKLGEEIVIDGDIRITVVEVANGRVKLGITAPKTVRVDRSEVREQREKADEPLPLTKPIHRFADVVTPGTVQADAIVTQPLATPPAATPEPLPNRLPPPRPAYKRKSR